MDPKNFFKVLTSTPRSQVAEMVLDPIQSTGDPTNKHINSDQWLFVISGVGKAIINKKDVNIRTGDLLLIEAGENHEIGNTSKNQPLKTFNMYAPAEY